jgi:hypothetical protein
MHNMRPQLPVGSDRPAATAGCSPTFARAAGEQDEPRRLKASGKPYACLELVGAVGYGEE